MMIAELKMKKNLKESFMFKQFLFFVVFTIPMLILLSETTTALPQGDKYWTRLAEKPKFKRLQNIEHFSKLRDDALQLNLSSKTSTEMTDTEKSDMAIQGELAVYFATMVYYYDWATVPIYPEDLIEDGYLPRMPMNPWTFEDMKFVKALEYSPGNLVYQIEPSGMWKRSCDCGEFYWMVSQFSLSVFGGSPNSSLQNPQVAEDLKGFEWAIVPNGSIDIVTFLKAK